MPLDAYDVTAICPYYKSHAKLSITCEWVARRTLSVKFPSAASVVKHLTHRCCKRTYAECPIAAVMNRYYSGNGRRKPVERKKNYPSKITTKEIPGQTSLF